MADFDEVKPANENSSDALESPGASSDGSDSGVVSIDDTLALAASMKEQGNDLFKSGDVPGARSAYEAGLDAVKALSKASQEKENVKSVLVALYGNVCMCAVKSEDWSASIEAASEAIKCQNNNVKSLYRRGLSYHKVKKYDKAKKDLMECLKLDPANAPAKKELMLLEKAIVISEKKSAAALKAAYAGNMFGNSDKGSMMTANRRVLPKRSARRTRRIDFVGRVDEE